MVNINTIFPSRYLSAVDLNGTQPTVTISAIEVIDLENDGRKERKLVASFEGKQKQLVLNKTNSRSLADMYGEDTDEWIGKSLKLVTARVDFQGRRVDAIRIDPPARKEQTTTPVSMPKPTLSQMAAGTAPDFDDEVPFAPNFL